MSRASAVVSPHTRGWTRVHARGGAPAVGFPAHAGMDPSPAWPGPVAWRFPRTRGDGPRRYGAKVAGDWVSPHTRGWTRTALSPTGCSGGFPAHAGMDPPRWTPCRRGGRFPRTRGDGPSSISLSRRLYEVSPHTRGWTLAEHRLLRHLDGFPAHAGMDPDAGADRPGRPRFPRHTRGWTRRRVGRADVPDGFPAHAGMDPARSCCGTRRSRFPRTRGDGPPSSTDCGQKYGVSPHTRGRTPAPPPAPPPAKGFPAHAGTDPRIRCRRSLAYRFPRTRGDGPVPEAMGEAEDAVSPHTRGWTPHVAEEQPDHHGFPAHAGMDPCSTRTPATPCGFPRTRGDGPVRGGWFVGIVKVSPHTRGWTCGTELPAGRQAGFPAHAGMDLRQCGSGNMKRDPVAT